KVSVLAVTVKGWFAPEPRLPLTGETESHDASELALQLEAPEPALMSVVVCAAGSAPVEMALKFRVSGERKRFVPCQPPNAVAVYDAELPELSKALAVNW